MPFGGPNSERALILAPRGRDAEVASKLLQEAGWPTLICANIGQLCAEFNKGAAVVVIVEEALATDDLEALTKCIKAQSPWSDFPLVVMTERGDTPARNELADRLQDLLGNVTFLERPFHSTTPLSVARSALRSRRRQYETRELLERREHGLERFLLALGEAREGQDHVLEDRPHAQRANEALIVFFHDNQRITSMVRG